MPIKREQISDFTVGMDFINAPEKTDKFELLENMSVYNKNASLRGGTTLKIDIPATIGATTISLPIKSVHTYKLAGQNIYFIECGEHLIQADTLDDSTNWTIVMTGLDIDYRLHSMPFQNYLYFFNGANYGFYFNGSSIVSLYSMPKVKYACECNGRFWVYHFDYKANKFGWSGIAESTAGQMIYPDDSKAWNLVESDYGENILEIDDEGTGMINYFNKIIFLFMRYHTFMLTGLESNNPIEFKKEELKINYGVNQTKSVGCISYESIQIKNGTLFWASEDGLMAYNSNGFQNLCPSSEWYDTNIKRPQNVEIIHTGGENVAGREFANYDKNGVTNELLTFLVTGGTSHGFLNLATLYGCDTALSAYMTDIAKSYDNDITTYAISQSNQAFVASYAITAIDIKKLKVTYKWSGTPTTSCVLRVIDTSDVSTDIYTFGKELTDTTVEIDVNMVDIKRIEIYKAAGEALTFTLYEIYFSEGTAESTVIEGTGKEWGKLKYKMYMSYHNGSARLASSELSDDATKFTFEIKASKDNITWTVYQFINNGDEIPFTNDYLYLQFRITFYAYIYSTTIIMTPALQMLRPNYWVGGLLTDKPCSIIWDNSYYLFSSGKSLEVDINNALLTHSIPALTCFVLENQEDKLYYPMVAKADDRGIWVFNDFASILDYNTDVVIGTISTPYFFAEDRNADKILKNVRISTLHSEIGQFTIYFKKYEDDVWTLLGTYTPDVLDMYKIEKRLPNDNTKACKLMVVITPAIGYTPEINNIELEMRLRPIQP